MSLIRERREAWDTINRADSAAVAMRAVSATLRGEWLNIWDLTRWQGILLRLASYLGQRTAINTIERFTATSGIDPLWASQITTEDLATWAVSLYNSKLEQPAAPLEAVIVGAPNGGVIHLATALGVPFLSQSFLTSFRQPCVHPDDVAAYQAYGADLADKVTQHNSDLAVINHYDPLHDRLLVKYLNHIRYKLLDLPYAYQAFILERVRSGGTIFFSDCRYSWPLYFVGERQWFQVGGLGGVRPREFIQGHPSIAKLQRAAGVKPRGHWALEGRMAFEMPESEWGMMPPFREAVQNFARQYGYQFKPLDGAHPQDFALMAFNVWRTLFAEAGVEPRGVLLETFTQIAPHAVRLGGLLPVWLPWNYAGCLTFLRQIRSAFPEGKPVFWLPLPDFADTFDRASWDDWMEALDGLDVHPVGMKRRLYPFTPGALYTTHRAMARWVKRHRPEKPITHVIAPATVAEEARVARIRT